MKEIRHMGPARQWPIFVDFDWHETEAQFGKMDRSEPPNQHVGVFRNIPRSLNIDAWPFGKKGFHPIGKIIQFCEASDFEY